MGASTSAWLVSGCSAPRVLAHVDDLHRRQRPAVDARGQPHAAQRVDALGPRRGAAGDEQRAGLLGAARGDVAGVVARVALVLVGAVVLLVDDDQPEPLDRREDGRARADADARGARAQAAPLVVALAGGELGVQDRDGVAEAVDEAADDLRRQRDLGDEHDHAAVLRERGRGGAQVDLGLARAGDAVQQQRLRRAAAWLPSPPRSRRARASGRRSAAGCARRAPTRLVLDVAARRAARRARRGRGPPGGAAPAGRRPRRAAARPAAPAGARSAGGLRRRRVPRAAPTR